ncbi:hypothetical protein HDU84_001398 [Entophlyctis sp. JEL0112]|nr:hypothetical protein HDU84_001398 [Entophlyctis sp. JEL0112]
MSVFGLLASALLVGLVSLMLLSALAAWDEHRRLQLRLRDEQRRGPRRITAADLSVLSPDDKRLFEPQLLRHPQHTHFASLQSNPMPRQAQPEKQPVLLQQRLAHRDDFAPRFSSSFGPSAESHLLPGGAQFNGDFLKTELSRPQQRPISRSHSFQEHAQPLFTQNQGAAHLRKTYSDVPKTYSDVPKTQTDVPLEVFANTSTSTQTNLLRGEAVQDMDIVENTADANCDGEADLKRDERNSHEETLTREPTPVSLSVKKRRQEEVTEMELSPLRVQKARKSLDDSALASLDEFESSESLPSTPVPKPKVSRTSRGKLQPKNLQPTVSTPNTSGMKRKPQNSRFAPDDEDSFEDDEEMPESEGWITLARYKRRRANANGDFVNAGSPAVGAASTAKKQKPVPIVPVNPSPRIAPISTARGRVKISAITPMKENQKREYELHVLRAPTPLLRKPMTDNDAKSIASAKLDETSQQSSVPVLPTFAVSGIASDITTSTPFSSRKVKFADEAGLSLEAGPSLSLSAKFVAVSDDKTSNVNIEADKSDFSVSDSTTVGNASLVTATGTGSVLEKQTSPKLPGTIKPLFGDLPSFNPVGLPNPSSSQSSESKTAPLPSFGADTSVVSAPLPLFGSVSTGANVASTSVDSKNADLSDAAPNQSVAVFGFGKNAFGNSSIALSSSEEAAQSKPRIEFSSTSAIQNPPEKSPGTGLGFGQPGASFSGFKFGQAAANQSEVPAAATASFGAKSEETKATKSNDTLSAAPQIPLFGFGKTSSGSKETTTADPTPTAQIHGAGTSSTPATGLAGSVANSSTSLSTTASAGFNFNLSANNSTVPSFGANSSSSVPAFGTLPSTDKPVAAGAGMNSGSNPISFGASTSGPASNLTFGAKISSSEVPKFGNANESAKPTFEAPKSAAVPSFGAGNATAPFGNSTTAPFGTAPALGTATQSSATITFGTPGPQASLANFGTNSSQTGASQVSFNPQTSQSGGFSFGSGASAPPTTQAQSGSTAAPFGFGTQSSVQQPVSATVPSGASSGPVFAFGGSTQATSGGFGVSSAQTQAVAPAFGQGFGSTTTPTASSTAGVFGATTTGPTAGPAAVTFAFGGSGNGGNAFGATANQPTAAPSASFQFGSQPAGAATTNAGAFGQPPQQQQQQQQAGAFAFGTPAASGATAGTSTPFAFGSGGGGLPAQQQSPLFSGGGAGFTVGAENKMDRKLAQPKTRMGARRLPPGARR